MNNETKQSAKTENERTCEKCGRYNAIEMGDQFLCEECITLAGCACAEREAETG